MPKKIYSYKGKIGETELHIAGKGENFRKGMEMLSGDIKGRDHWFRCKKCGAEWQDDSFCSHYLNCPKCGNPRGKTLGCGGTCSKIHGIWEGIEGVCKCDDKVPVYTPKQFAEKVVDPKKQKAFWKWYDKFPKRRKCFTCKKVTVWSHAFIGQNIFPFCKVCGSNLGHNVK